jgi:hypothetical protein
MVFDGLDEGDLREIVLLEIKSGASQLNRRQQQVRAAIDEGRVRFEIAQVLTPEPLADQPESPPETPERPLITRTAGGPQIVTLPRRRRRMTAECVSLTPVDCSAGPHLGSGWMLIPAENRAKPPVASFVATRVAAPSGCPWNARKSR